MDTGNWDPAYCPDCGGRCTNWETIHRKCEIKRAYKAGLQRAIEIVEASKEALSVDDMLEDLRAELTDPSEEK